MTPLDAARLLAGQSEPTCPPGYGSTRALCRTQMGEDHAPDCPWEATSQVVAALEQGERLRAAAQAILNHIATTEESDFVIVDPFRTGADIFKFQALASETIRAALHGQEPAADAAPQDEMIPCPNGCLGRMGEGTYDDGTAGRPVPMYCGVNGCDVESPGMVYRE